MKRKDMHVGMVVAIGNYSEVRDGCGRRAVVVDLGFWRAKSGGYGEPDVLVRREKFRPDHQRIAVARQFGSNAELSDNVEPKADTDWRPGVELTKDVFGSWDDALEEHRKAKEGREQSRKYREHQDNQSWEVHALLCSHGIRFRTERHDNVAMTISQVSMLIDKLTSLGSTPAKVVVHAQKKFPNRAFCDDEPVGFETGDPTRLGADIYPDHSFKRITCGNCLAAMEKMDSKDIVSAL